MHFRISTSAECTSTEVLLYQTPSQSLSNSLKTLEFCSNASVRCEQMDNNSKSQPLKNRKTKSNGLVVEDRISHLPDAILCHILSFTPTKYSIRTSVLSRRWEHLWALAHKFDLKLNSWFSFFYSTEEVKRFMELCYTFTHSINNLLSIRDRMHIEIFKIHFVGYFNFFRLHSSSWIATIVMFNVREVDLSIRDSNSDLGELPGCLFTCGTLVVLKLFGKFILNVPQRVCLPNLKTLRLESVLYLGDLSIHKLLSGCPLLEDMQILVHAHEPMPIQGVSHSSLKRFLFYSVPDDDPHTIVVDSPNLEFIDITNGLLSDISLNHFPNIVEAHININYLSGLHRINSGSAYKVFRMFQCIANVRRLFLSEKTLQFLDFAIPDLLPVFGNLVQLELCYNPFNGPILLMDLLHSSPKLEVLSFPGGIKFLRDDYNADDDDMNIDLDFRENDPERVPECLRQNLKIVEIKSFEGEEVELNIVKYLLKNGKLLEKMTITYWDPLPSVKFIWLQPELTDYPKLSTNCQLDLL